MKKANGIAAMVCMGIIMTAAFGVSAAESADAGKSFGEAAEIALKEAGAAEDTVVFSKKLREYQDGTEAYEIDFLIPAKKQAFDLTE